MTIMHANSCSKSRNRGFSMIDVLVAIVVLATALLALAALQGALTRNAADARARSQMAAYTEGLIEQLRSAGYSNIAQGTSTISPTSGTTAQKAIASSVQTASGVSKLSTTISTDFYNGSGTTFTKAASGVAAGATSYKQVQVTTTWTDASGQPRSLAIDTIVDATQTSQNDQTLINKGFTITGSATPIVRQYNPAATAGVIPIAIGNGSDTAATNPQPEVLGKKGSSVSGVSFNVLTYTAPADVNGNKDQTIIQQHVDTRVVTCSCKWGAGVTDSNNVFAQAYKATYWDGTKYVAPATKTVNSPPGVDSTVTQDTYCDVCCRDRNDATGSDVKFDPFTSDYKHYRYSGNSLVEVPSGDSNAYLNACRLIRVDGQYRVATDLQNYFFGLLATTTTGTSAIPDPTAVTNYEQFITDYLDASISSLAAGNGPADTATWTTKYGSGTYNLDAPANITLTGSTDKRYLHARGLYIDHLEADALKAINNAISTCPSGKSTSDCVFPLLPFTTINETELANWTTTTSSITAANTPAPTTDDPTSPLRGFVTQLKADGSTPSAQATIGKSNSGVVGNIAAWAVDPDDLTTSQDTQQFTTSGSSGGGGGGNSTIYFDITVSFPSGYDWVQKTAGTNPVPPTMQWNGTSSQLGTAVATTDTTPYSFSTTMPYAWNWYSSCGKVKGNQVCNPNSVTPTITAPVGLNVITTWYNRYTDNLGADSSAKATDGTNNTCPVATGALRCYNFPVDLPNVSITSGATGTVTKVTGASCTANPSGTCDTTPLPKNQAASAIVTIPATPGISSTDSTKPDIITIAFGTPSISVQTGTCVATKVKGKTVYVYNAATSCP